MATRAGATPKTAERTPVVRSAFAVGVLGEGGRGLLPWLAAPLAELRANPRSAHAVLIDGPAGVGQFELAIAAAQGALCEAPASPPGLACGRCVGCRLVQAQTHPDLLVLLPEALREPLGWSGSGGEGDAESASGTGTGSARRKPSRELRVDDLRSAIAFAQTTSTRGGRKVVVIHPAERMNGVSANALLKTLEEPPPAVQLLLSTGDAARLLPTLRSRCQSLRLGLPPADLAAGWLEAAGAGAGAAVLLQAAGGQPQEALALLADGIDAEAWSGLPERLRQGDAASLQGWPLPRLLQALLSLCHDLQRVGLGAAPRHFPVDSLSCRPSLPALNAWSRRLIEASRHADHPFHLPLAVEALVAQARAVLAPASPVRAPRRAGAR